MTTTNATPEPLTPLAELLLDQIRGGEKSISDLAARCGWSESQVRRDLLALRRRGLVHVVGRTAAARWRVGPPPPPTAWQPSRKVKRSTSPTPKVRARLLFLKTAAREFGIPLAHLRQMVAGGEIAFLRIGEDILVERLDLERWVQLQKERAAIRQWLKEQHRTDVEYRLR